MPARRAIAVCVANHRTLMEVGKPVRVLKAIDLGAEGKVEKGAVGILESMNNSVYMPFLVKFPQGTFAFEDGEIEDAPETPRETARTADNLKNP